MILVSLAINVEALKIDERRITLPQTLLWGLITKSQHVSCRNIWFLDLIHIT